MKSRVLNWYQKRHEALKRRIDALLLHWPADGFITDGRDESLMLSNTMQNTWNRVGVDEAGITFSSSIRIDARECT